MAPLFAPVILLFFLAAFARGSPTAPSRDAAVARAAAGSDLVPSRGSAASAPDTTFSALVTPAEGWTAAVVQEAIDEDGLPEALVHFPQDAPSTSERTNTEGASEPGSRSWFALIACARASPDVLSRARSLGAVGAALYARLDKACERHALLTDGSWPPHSSRAPASLLELQARSEPRHAAVTLQRRDNGQPNMSMIALYIITGCVSALFVIVIASGVIRAVRHPERYTRNEGGFTGGPGGTLTRAIIDTFPVIKFHSTGGRTEQDQSDDAEKVQARDSELYEMGVLPDQDKKVAPDAGHALPELRIGAGVGDEPVSSDDEQPVASPSSVQVQVRPRVPPPPAAQGPSSDPMPDQIGRETCPICIVDFEEGDDLRVLPCEGQHRFHQRCVDPWLLELSTSCPICRQDFQALQDIISGETEDGHGYREHTERRASSYGRFSKYVRFVRRRQRGDDYDATNPPMPLAPDGSYYEHNAAV